MLGPCLRFDPNPIYRLARNVTRRPLDRKEIVRSELGLDAGALLGRPENQLGREAGALVGARAGAGGGE